MKAIDRFDPARGTAFSTFAVPTILGELKRHFRDRGWSVHVPRDVQERILKVERATAELPAKLLELLVRQRALEIALALAGRRQQRARMRREGDAVTPAAGEPVLPPLGPDKFIGSELEKTLKDKGIKTVVAMGTQAQTSVLHTAGAAALRGFKVIVPVDGMSADDVFPELYTAWHLATAARISPQVTLTKFDLIGF